MANFQNILDQYAQIFPRELRNRLASELQTRDTSLDGAPRSSFVFRPGVDYNDDEPNIFPTWSMLMQNVNLSSGYKIIEFDDSSAECFVPAGTWDMTGCAWVGPTPRDGRIQTIVTVEEGAVLPGLRVITGNLEVICAATDTAPVSDFTDATSILFGVGGFDGVTILRCSGTVPFFDVDSGFLLVFVNGQWSSEAATQAPLRMGEDGQVQFRLLPAGFLGSNFVDASASGAFVNIDLYSSSPISTIQDSLTADNHEIRTPRSRTRFLSMPASTFSNAAVPSTSTIEGPKTDRLLLFDTTAGDIAQDLPDILTSFPTSAGPSFTFGHLLMVKNALGANEVIVSPVSGNLIDGSASSYVVKQGSAVIFWSDGVNNWYTLAQYAPSSAEYTASNVVTDRSYDANATTLDELADVVGTLIADLKAQNILS